jgi:hypothetical protein
METSVRDIDVITDGAGADAIPQRLGGRIVRPVTSGGTDRIRSRFGVLECEGWTIEVMGEVEFRAADGAWEPPVDVRGRRVFVALGPDFVPVMPLPHEIHMYERLGRSDKAAALRRFTGVW